MFSLDVVDTDLFLEMPVSTQNLYFHLSMRADDDWFISSPNKIMKMTNSSKNDMDILILKSFIIPFDSWICVIRHWRINNYLRWDRYTPTIHKEELGVLLLQDDVYTRNTAKSSLGIPDGLPMVDTGKNSIDKNSKDNIRLIESLELNFIDWYEQDKIEFIKYRNTLVKTKEWDICRWQKQNTFDLWLRFKTWIRKSWWKEQKQIVVLTDDELLFKDKSWLSDSDTKEIYKYCQENWKTSKVKVWEEYVWEEYWVPVYRPKYVLMPDIQFVKSRVQSIEKRAKDKWTTLNNLSSLFIKWQQ